MNIDFGWIAWFFYGSAPVWIAALLCFAVMALCLYLDRVHVLVGAAMLAILLIALGTFGGLYNVSRMSRCQVCKKPLPPEYAYGVCAAHMDAAQPVVTPTGEDE